MVNASVGQGFENCYSVSCSDPCHKCEDLYDLSTYEKRCRDQTGMENPAGTHVAPARRYSFPTSQDHCDFRPVTPVKPRSHHPPPPPVVDALSEQLHVSRYGPVGVSAPLRHYVAPESFDRDSCDLKEVKCAQDHVSAYLAHLQPPPLAKSPDYIDCEDEKLLRDQRTPEQPVMLCQIEIPETPPAIQMLPEVKLESKVFVAAMSPHEMLPPGGYNDQSFPLTNDIISASVPQPLLEISFPEESTDCHRDILLPVSEGIEGDALSIGCDAAVVGNYESFQENMLICDGFDKGLHTACLVPPLIAVPSREVSPYCTVSVRPPPAPTW